VLDSAKKSTTQPKKVLIFNMKLWKSISIICLIEKKPPLQQSSARHTWAGMAGVLHHSVKPQTLPQDTQLIFFFATATGNLGTFEILYDVLRHVR
jgi:hypothetical protein